MNGKRHIYRSAGGGGGGAGAGPARRAAADRPSHLSLSLRPIALSLRPSAARSSSSCKVKVTSDVLCYNRWGALRQVQCLVESGRDTWLATIAKRASLPRRGLCPACDIRTVKSSWTWVLNLFELYHVTQTSNCVSGEPSKVRKQDSACNIFTILIIFFLGSQLAKYKREIFFMRKRRSSRGHSSASRSINWFIKYFMVVWWLLQSRTRVHLHMR